MKPTLFFIILMLLTGSISLSAATGRIYGKVLTTEDEIFEGWIRWDKHETYWDDYLDATKKYFISTDLDDELLLKIYGPFKVYRDEKEFRTNSTIGLQFGHINRIVKKSNHSALIELKDGRQLKVTGSGTDIGNSNRGIEIDDLNFGKITINWKSFESVEFMEERKNYKKQKKNDEAYRLYGIVETRNDEIFEGYIMWDNDETLSADILNGKYRGRDMEIPFEKIKSIRRDSNVASIVELQNGTRITMTGSNDVGRGHRGIIVKDLHYGELHVPWSAFQEIELKPEVTKFLLKYHDFNGGKPLFGEVINRDGEKYKGYICWDNDETFTNDILDGKYNNYDINIEFSTIYAIEYDSRKSAIIELWNEQRFKASGSNDVDYRNKGIYIMTENGNETIINWEDFEKVVFSK